jgi:GH25 family lysozyme M1 (1,4-beta-N-acetylmuramidase)
MKTGRTKKSLFKRARWDRIFLALLILVGIIVAIVVLINKHNEKIPDAPASKPDISASQFFNIATAQDIDSAEPAEDSAKNNLLSGADISKHNGEIVTNGDFVIVKATEGVGYVDPRFEENVQNALNNSQLTGVYHYARPDTGNTPSVEAEHFVETIKPYLGKVMLVLDWEEEEAIDNTLWVSSWMWEVYQKTGVRPVLYTSASVAADYNWAGISSEFDLWVACYTQDSAELPNYEISDYDLSEWRTIIWQYSTAGELDRNVSSLTAEEWQSRCLSNDEKTTGADLMKTMQQLSASTVN